MPAGVYTAYKKDGTVYYRSSITHKNKHISLGSFSSENEAAVTYNEACEILSRSDLHIINTELHTTSYSPDMNIPFEKYIILVNFRDNWNIYKDACLPVQKVFSLFSVT